MKIFRKTIEFLDKITDIGLFVFCLFIFLIGLYALYDSYMIYMRTTDDDITKYRPGYEKEEDDDNKKILDSMVAWLTVTDTNIDYPVMQGKDNNEFLNTDPFGDYSLSGSIFLDSRNDPKFKDEYSLIYGHHMEHGFMFGALDEYLDHDYFETHKYGKLTVGEKEYQLEMFAVLETDATNSLLFAPTEEKKEDTIAFIRKKALFIEEESLPKKIDDSRIVALSTCKYPATSERTIVIGIITN